MLMNCTQKRRHDGSVNCRTFSGDEAGFELVYARNQTMTFLSWYLPDDFDCYDSQTFLS